MNNFFFQFSKNHQPIYSSCPFLVAVRKLLDLKKWAGGLEKENEKRAGGIDKLQGFLKIGQKKLYMLKKFSYDLLVPI